MVKLALQLFTSEQPSVLVTLVLNLKLILLHSFECEEPQPQDPVVTSRGQVHSAQQCFPQHAAWRYSIGFQPLWTQGALS